MLCATIMTVLASTTIKVVGTSTRSEAGGVVALANLRIVEVFQQAIAPFVRYVEKLGM